VLNADSMSKLASAPSDARVDLLFEAEQVSGTSGCNRYGGPYHLEGNKLTFGNLFSTQMACEQPFMNLEAAYLAALGKVDKMDLQADGLTLSGGGVSLSYAAESPPQPSSLNGTKWVLDAIGEGGDAVSSPLGGTEVTLELEADGSAHGNGGCNRFTVDFELDGPQIRFGPIASTKMSCEQPVMDQEAKVLQGLDKAASWDIQQNVLTLYDAGGEYLLSFRDDS
jgi:heat shock protein HslJ